MSAPTDDPLTTSLDRLSLNNPRTPKTPKPQPQPPESSGTPKSFLQSMNEKLAQKPRKPRRRAQPGFGSKTSCTPASSSSTTPSSYSDGTTKLYVLDNDKAVLGVYSSIEKASAAARLCGAEKEYLEQPWTGGRAKNCGNHVRIIVEKVGKGKGRDVGKEDEGRAGGRSSADGEENAPKGGDITTVHAGDARSKDKGIEMAQDRTILPMPSSAQPATSDDKISQHPNTARKPAPLSPMSANTLPQTIFIALDRSLCLGLFASKSLAWEACMKHKTQMTYAVELKNEKRWVDKEGMPYLQGAIGGVHCWCVRRCGVDEMLVRGRRNGA